MKLKRHIIINTLIEKINSDHNKYKIIIYTIIKLMIINNKIIIYSNIMTHNLNKLTKIMNNMIFHNLINKIVEYNIQYNNLKMNKLM